MMRALVSAFALTSVFVVACTVENRGPGTGAGSTIGTPDIDTSDPTAESGTCNPGEACICDGAGSCEKTCSGKGCHFQCKGTGSCNLTCTQGSCTVTSTGAGSTNLRCPGGDCIIDCNGAGSCNVESGCGGCQCNANSTGTCNK